MVIIADEFPVAGIVGMGVTDTLGVNVGVRVGAVLIVGDGLGVGVSTGLSDGEGVGVELRAINVFFVVPIDGKLTELGVSVGVK